MWIASIAALLMSSVRPSADVPAATAAAPAPAVLSAWVQLKDQGQAEARAVVDGGACPVAVVDGRPRRMRVRVRPGLAFPDSVCVADVPRGAERVTVGGRTLKGPPAEIRRIVIIGDTGCRVQGLNLQACNDPGAWPFAALARRAAAERPDLVIHVGDYYYRETACPAFYAGCAGSPHGDAWPTWRTEFFDPARPLLEAAPWVLVRGNHESCERGWRGWFRMLDAGPAPGAACPGAAEPFSVPIGGVTLKVLDSADTVDRTAPAGAVVAFRQQLDRLLGDAPGSDWIVTHRPVWAEVFAQVWPFGVFRVDINRTEQAAMKGRDLAPVQMVVSGHIHDFSAYDFGEGRPAQLVSGAGGDVGDPGDPQRPNVRTTRIDGMSAHALTVRRFGYVVMDLTADGWSGVFKDVEGRAVATCAVKGRRLECRPD